MRVFQELLVDEFLENTNLQAAPYYWEPALGGVDDIRFMIIVDRISGTTPTLQVFVNDTPDLTDRHASALGTILPTQMLTAGQTNVYAGSLSTSAATPGSYGYRLWYQLGGTGGPKAHVRIWATGRGRA